MKTARRARVLKVGARVEIRFKGYLSGEFKDGWLPGMVTGFAADLEGDGKRINVTTDDGRVWDGCAAKCVRAVRP